MTNGKLLVSESWIVHRLYRSLVMSFGSSDFTSRGHFWPLNKIKTIKWIVMKCNDINRHLEDRLIDGCNTV